MKKENGQNLKEGTEKKVSMTLPPCGLAEDILGSALSESNTLPGEDSGKRRNNQNQEFPPAGDVPVSAESAKKENLDLNSFKFVTFFLDGEEYGLPITQVQEINRVTEITRVPNLPEHVRGVINLRGRIVPVIELKRRLRLGDSKIDKDSRIVLVEHGTKLLGLMVDKVAQVLNIPSNQIDDTPEDVQQVSGNYVQGIGKIENRMIILLDLDKIV